MGFGLGFDAPSYDIDLERHSEMPLERLVSEIGHSLRFKGHCVLKLGLEEDLLEQATEQAVDLKRAGKLQAPSTAMYSALGVWALRLAIPSGEGVQLGGFHQRSSVAELWQEAQRKLQRSISGLLCAGQARPLRRRWTLQEAQLEDGDTLCAVAGCASLCSKQWSKAFALIRADGKVVTWGAPTCAGDSLAVQHLLQEVVQISASSCAFAAVRADGRVVTWGDAGNGGDSGQVQDQLRDVVHVCGTLGAFCAIRRDGTAVTWGHEMAGGESSQVAEELREVQEICASDRAFAALRSDGRVVAWGGGSALHALRGEGVVAENVRRLAATSRAFAAICDGGVVAWGHPEYGGDCSGVQEQLQTTRELSASFSAFAAIQADGSVVTWGAEVAGGNVPPEVRPKLREVRQICATNAAFAAIAADGRVITWGEPAFGGDSEEVQDQLYEVEQISGTSRAFAAIRADGRVVTWGAPWDGGDSSAVQDQLWDVQQICGSACAFAAVRCDGQVVTWGGAFFGGDARTAARCKSSFGEGTSRPPPQLIDALLGPEGTNEYCRLDQLPAAEEGEEEVEVGPELQKISRRLNQLAGASIAFCASDGHDNCMKSGEYLVRGGDYSDEVAELTEVFGGSMSAVSGVLLYDHWALTHFLRLADFKYVLCVHRKSAGHEPLQLTRTEPDMLIILRADQMHHKHQSSRGEYSVISWILDAEHATTRGWTGALSRTFGVTIPTARELLEWSQDRLKELVDDEEADVPREWQLMTRHSFFRNNRNPVAVRGEAGHMPTTNSNRVLWDTMNQGSDFVTNVPYTRWDHEPYYSSDPDCWMEANCFGRGIIRTSVNHGQFIEGIDLFDNKFFGVSNMEAQGMDPMQRHVLETSYEALFNAGYNKKAGVLLDAHPRNFLQSQNPAAKYALAAEKSVARTAVDALKEILKSAAVIALQGSIAFSFIGNILNNFFPGAAGLPSNPCTFATSTDWGKCVWQEILPFVQTFVSQQFDQAFESLWQATILGYQSRLWALNTTAYLNSVHWPNGTVKYMSNATRDRMYTELANVHNAMLGNINLFKTGYAINTTAGAYLAHFASLHIGVMSNLIGFPTYRTAGDKYVFQTITACYAQAVYQAATQAYKARMAAMTQQTQQSGAQCGAFQPAYCLLWGGTFTDSWTGCAWGFSATSTSCISGPCVVPSDPNTPIAAQQCFYDHKKWVENQTVSFWVSWLALLPMWLANVMTMQNISVMNLTTMTANFNFSCQAF
ncbi:unnamed protein product [Effrenium voratum]|nr:unnamed protein product [Effrenium voratum]